MSELCLKEETVLIFKDVGGKPAEIHKIVAPELLPLCFNENVTMDDIEKWLLGRGIEDKREGLQRAKEFTNGKWQTPKDAFLLGNYRYLSLSDHYWIKKRDETWKKINYFGNRYSTDIGDIFFSPWIFDKQKINFNTPDLTTTGVLMKRWKQRPDKTSYLVKAGSYTAKQEPLSEVLVSVLIERLNVPVLKSAGYDLTVEGATMCSKCDNFITPDIDLVPASYLYFKEKRRDDETVYSHLIDACEKYEIPNAKEYIDWLIFVDNYTGNSDRHLENIAFLRDMNTMKFIGPAPVYDCGNAYWSTKAVNEERKSVLFGDVESQIFKRQMKKCNLDVIAKNEDYKPLIEAYPGISDEKKENLIEAIKKRNRHMCLEGRGSAER